MVDFYDSWVVCEHGDMEYGDRGRHHHRPKSWKIDNQDDTTKLTAGKQ